LGKKLIEKQLSKENCKAILPWSNAAKNSISDVIKNKNILNKINILPFATDLKNKTKKKHEGINLLFVGRYFYQKGGQDTLKVFDNLTKKYDDVNATFVSDVPKEYLDKYSKNKKINFLNLMPQKELFKKVYPNSDIFVYPGYSDSYGFSFIEAKAFKLPIITVDGFARDDVVEDNKDGYIIRNPKITWKNNLPIINNKQVILDMQSKIKELIENNNLRKKFGNNGYKKVESGIFSIDYRNKKLKEIYDVCL
jgi:glycosyltransferase involved in cell wall biosynthesis